MPHQAQPNLEMDAWGNPVFGDWYYAAFVNSTTGKKWITEMEIWRDKLDRDPSLEPSVMESNLIQIGESFSERDVETAFELDWYQMKWRWLGFSMSEQNMTALKSAFSRNYAILCHLFAHYCGYGQGNFYFFETILC
jgi:hypothetical protein